MSSPGADDGTRVPEVTGTLEWSGLQAGIYGNLTGNPPGYEYLRHYERFFCVLVLTLGKTGRLGIQRGRTRLDTAKVDMSRTHKRYPGLQHGDSCTLVANDLCKVVVVSSILIVSTARKLSFSASSVTVNTPVL